MLKIIGIILLLIVLAIGLSFTVLNADPVQLNYYFGSSEIPLAVALVVAIAIGVMFGLLGTLSVVIKLKRQIMKLNKTARSAERELTQLRAIPAKDTP